MSLDIIQTVIIFILCGVTICQALAIRDLLKELRGIKWKIKS
jgi:hypothetical protein